jgi:chromosome segregation ATPase
MMTDELERRVRTLEEELGGERHVSRYMVEQAGRSSEVLHTVRSEVAAARADISGATARVDVLAGDMASVKAALVMHGRALDVLQQDVRQLRSDAADLRRELEEFRAHVDARFDAVLEAIRGMARE